MKPLEELLRMLQHVVLDMDGTIYVGEKLFDATLPFFEMLTALDIQYSFITNNNSRSRSEYIEYLESMGILASSDQIFTSAQASLEYMATHMPDLKDVFLVGTLGLQQDLEEGGLTITQNRPDAVIVGFDPHFTYDRLAQAAYWISQGVPYVATHPDLICPTNRPTVLPDCGAICALLEAATGRCPDVVPGKPSSAMLEGVMIRNGINPSETAMIGDRLYTDIRMARDAGVLAVLTLTGEATVEQVEQSEVKPDMIVADLNDFADKLCDARG